MQNNNDYDNNKLGGKVLASGGFGCIFTPSLKCLNSNKREKNTVSKLMTLKNAKEEYDEVLNSRHKIINIPNYKKYFLIDNYTLCKPNKLTKSDLNNFNKCSALKKQNITKKNINNSLDELLALNMPYGGITLENFISNNKNYNKLTLVNNHLIQLLKNGIVPMNKKNIYHSDIKASNILLDEKDKNKNMIVRLIDWSLTTEYVPFKNNEFPHNWKNRPLQFNVPFSIVLFTDLFVNEYSSFLEKNKKLSREHLEKFVKKYLPMWFKERGLGHFKYINRIMYMLFNNELETEKNIDLNSINDSEEKEEYIKKFIEKKYTFPFIINYLVGVLLHFTKFKSDGSLNLRFYLDNIFIQIIDIWGFIVSYLPLYELLFENYYNLTNNQVAIFKKLKYIFLKYLYQPRIKPIEIEDLEYELKDLNKLLEI
jgi:serine/threonine protein kinase